MFKHLLRRFSAPRETRNADDVLVILNHNPANPREPGDVELFVSAEALTGDVFATDVRTGEYLALDTTGRIVTMTEASKDSDAEIVVSVTKYATDAQLAGRMLKYYLRRQLEDRELPYTAEAVDREINVTKLVGLVSAKDVFG